MENFFRLTDEEQAEQLRELKSNLPDIFWRELQVKGYVWETYPKMGKKSRHKVKKLVAALSRVFKSNPTESETQPRIRRKAANTAEELLELVTGNYSTNWRKAVADPEVNRILIEIAQHFLDTDKNSEGDRLPNS